jgi:hypothetical protein
VKLQTLLLALALLALSCSEDTGSDAATANNGELDVGVDVPRDASDVPGDGSPDVGDDTLPETCESDRDCDDGAFCNGAERCFNGTCFASRRPQCEDHVPCTRDGCNEEERFCEFLANAEDCEEGQVCDLKAGCFTPAECQRNEDCDDGLVCNGEEICGRDGMCAPGVPLNCNDAVLCTSDECVEELGACQNVPDHTQCLPTELCNVQEGCEEPPPCSNDDDCNDASFCNGEETCDVETGACIPGAVPTVDDGVPCTIDICSDELGQVVHTPHAARCSDGLFCNGAETCHPVDGCQEGEPPVLSDGVGCTTDTCDEEADFVVHTPNAGNCDDGLFCNGDEVCHPVDDCQPGEPPVVNDGVGCTTDTCSEVERAVLNIPGDEACDDGLFCNGNETCDPDAGCMAGTAPVVDDGFDCTTDSCDEGADRVVHTPSDDACDDGQFCTGVERCSPDLGCVDGTPPALDDGVGCTADRCDEDRDEVIHAPDHAACDDGQFCTGTETCDAERDCISSGAPELDDEVGCTDDRCDEENDQVIHIPRHAQCDDGRFCNGAETCDVADDCQDGAPPLLTDLVGCTDDRCDEVNDQVIHVPNHALCDNGLFCDGAETCDARADCQDGVAPQLSDGVGCTIDRCNEQEDEVTHTVDHDACQDGQWCNGEEICDLRNDCQDGTPRTVTDNVGCTDDRCDEAGDRILHTPNHASCDDNLWCNGDEVCDVVDDCQDGTPRALNDQVGCTDDRCDEAGDRVIHVPNDGLCDNQLFCDGRETCHPTDDCQDGTAPTLTDNVGCTIDRCDEQTDTITHTPNHQSCQDGFWCNGNEVCDEQNDCQDGTPRVLTDDVDCTDDACDEDANRIVHTVNHDNCDDTLWCNGAETCHPQNDCQDGTAPMEEDEVPCTEAVCDEDNDEIVQTPRHERCADQDVCNGQETCRREFGCLPGIDADDGTVCQENPERVCMGGVCVDGDPGFPWDGRFDVEPDVAYQCAPSIFIPGFFGVDYSFTHLQFNNDNDVVLQVTPSPNGPNTIFTMEQRPTPGDSDFSVAVTLPGLSCHENYTLTGTFITDDQWIGTFQRTYINPGGLFGDCLDCQDGSVQLVGTRE